MNASKEGTPSMMGAPYKRIGFIEVCEALKNSPHYKSKLNGKNRGRGVGFGFWFNAGLQSSALVNIHADGTASVVTGNPDIGGSRASMAMIAAEILGLAVEDVRPSVADTDSIGQCDLTGGSRVTMATGLAVYEAAQRCHPPDEGARREAVADQCRKMLTTSTARSSPGTTASRR